MDEVEFRKHPHGRGEDPCRVIVGVLTLETPPRAWGRLQRDYPVLNGFRNTPTGVGKTVYSSGATLRDQKHPHGRGEDYAQNLLLHKDAETPPRAWGRPIFITPKETCKRNTPTGVGKTLLISLGRYCQEKHPHGRGEDSGT